MLLGIDVSHYSGRRDWRGLADAGIGFAFVKATEGATVRDDLFGHHWRGLHQAGVPCGAYHFGHPGSDAATQAACFHSVVGDLAPGDLQPVLDLEVGDGHPADYVVEWAQRFVDQAEALFGVQLIIYTGGFWRNQLGDPACPALGGRKLWTARYGGQPVLPRPWTRWSIWQFSDGVHSCPPDAAALGCHCDWNCLAEGVEIKDLMVAANPVGKADSPDATVRAPGQWPGRFFAYPASPPVQGDDVRQWQVRMGERGWALKADGVYGKRSRAACVGFQRHEGLVPDGIVGERTWGAAFGGEDTTG
jgi:lysozyme